MANDRDLNLYIQIQKGNEEKEIFKSDTPLNLFSIISSCSSPIIISIFHKLIYHFKRDILIGLQVY